MKTPIVPCFLSSNWWIFNGYVSFREGSQNTVHIFWLAVSHQVKISWLFASFCLKEIEGAFVSIVCEKKHF